MEIHFSFIQNIGHLILHTLPIFQVSYEYLARKTVFIRPQEKNLNQNRDLNLGPPDF